MTKYSDFISVREQKAAYNIEHEQGEDWKNFISNDIFNDILETIISSVRNNDLNKHKSFWIQGTYGTGKSHAGAVIKHLLCDEVEEIRDYVDSEFHDKLHPMLRDQLYSLRQQKRLLSVNLNGQKNITHRSDLAMQIQKAVKESLDEAGIVMPTVKTDFERYAEHIDENPNIWDTIIKDNAQLSSYFPTREKLLKEIKSEDIGAFNMARDAFRDSGIDLRLKLSDLPKWFFEVQNQLASQGTYSGLLVIWDEFTEIMKSDIGMSVLGELQNINELIMNSENNSYFLLISHPSAFNTLNPDEINKTKDRYFIFRYNMIAISAFHIMSSKIKRNDVSNEPFLQRLDSFYIENQQLYAKISDNKSSTIEDLKKLYPIHPSTLNLAAYYAREAGSNNRSVFKFLGENKAIQEFLDNEYKYENKELVTADYLWDYVFVEFTENANKYGAVTERYNSYLSHLTAKGDNYLKVFKGLLLLNALNNISQHETVVPSVENIHNLFLGTPIDIEVDDILNYFDNNSIVNKLPGDLFSIQFSALPRIEIESIKEKLRTESSQYKYTASVLLYGEEPKKQLDSLVANVLRAPHSIGIFGVDANEYTLKTKILQDYESKHSWELYMAMLFARNNQELNQLKEFADIWSKEDSFKNIVLIVFESCLTDQNYDRFIEYQANAQCARAHSLDDQQAAHSKTSKELILNWISSVRKGNFIYYLRDNSDKCATSKICTTINSSIAPVIFSSGPESLFQIQVRGNKNGWKFEQAKQMANNVLLGNTKTEIINKCTGTGVLFPILLQDSVDENLNWKEDVDLEHPLYKVFHFIETKFKNTDKSQPFNLGEKLKDLTKPPYGIYPSSVGIGMVSFAMRNWVNQIFDVTTGNPRETHHMIDDISEMFKCWDLKKISTKLEFRFEPKSFRNLNKKLIDIFKLSTVPGYSTDLASLTQTRWFLLDNYCKYKGYPLWALKYVNPDDENYSKIIDNLIKICNSTERDVHLITTTLDLFEKYQFEFTNLLNIDNNFQIGFNNYLKTPRKNIQINDSDIDDVFAYLKSHLQQSIGRWSEDEVEDKLKDWKIEHLTKDTPTATLQPTNTYNFDDTQGQSELNVSDSVSNTESSYLSTQKAVNRVSKMTDVGKMRDLLTKICRLNIEEIIKLINEE